MIKNKLYDLEYYNEDQKMRYLKTVADNETQYWLCARILGRVSRAEEMFGKDLYDFSLTQIERFLRYLNPSKLNTSRMNVYAVNNYLQWAISQDLSKTNINTLSIMMSDDYFKSFIDETKQTLFSEEEIEDMVNGAKNAQDKAMIQLLFEGVVGKGLEELLNLQRKNIDFDKNRLLLTNFNGSTRIVEVSDKCMTLIASALEQKSYIKKNGIYESDKGNPEIELVPSDYVIKRTIINSSKASSNKADKFIINRRLDSLAEEDIFDKPYLTTINIRNSGMLKIAKDYYLEFYTLKGNGCYDEIGEKFNIKKDRGNGKYVMYSYANDFLNIETIKKVYVDNSTSNDAISDAKK